jgi:hypothetical protein
MTTCSLRVSSFSLSLNDGTKMVHRSTQKAYASGRAMERVYYERTGKQFIAEDFEKYLAYCMEEEARDFREVPGEEDNAE